jgi:hypothetical protein
MLQGGVKSVILSRLDKDRFQERSMIEYFTALSLLFLVIGHGLLIKKCTKLTDELQPSADHLSTELKDITSILDDIADLFNDAIGIVNNSPLAQTPSSPMESILSGLISTVMSPKIDGTQQARAIQEIHPKENSETENQFD